MLQKQGWKCRGMKQRKWGNSSGLSFRDHTYLQRGWIKSKRLKRWRSAFLIHSCYTDRHHITKGVKPEWEMENRNQPLHSQRYPVLWGHPVHSIPLLHLTEDSWSTVRGWSYSYRKTSRQIHCWSYSGWWSNYDEAFGGRCQPHISGMRCHRFPQTDLRTCLHSQHAVQTGPFPGNLCLYIL